MADTVSTIRKKCPKATVKKGMTATISGPAYDRKLAEQFDAPDRLIIDEGEEIKIQ